MKKILIIISSLFLICLSCSTTSSKKEYNVSLEDGILTIIPLDTNTYDISVWNEDLKLFDKTLQDTFKVGIFSFLDEEAIYSLALSAIKNDCQISIKVNIDNDKENIFSIAIVPEECDSVFPTISGNCASLISKTNNITTDRLKRWLFKKKEYLPDSVLNVFAGLVRSISKNGITEYLVQGNLPVVKSLGNFKVKGDVMADHFALLACTSDKEIASFVEDCVAKNFSPSKNSLNEELLCYKMGSPNGFQCICLIGINDDWSYKAYPVGAVMIDNVPPINYTYNRLSDEEYTNLLSTKYNVNSTDIIFKSQQLKVIYPEKHPKIASSFRVSIGEWEGSLYSTPFPFTIVFSKGGDLDKIEVYNIKNEKINKTVTLKDVTSPQHFTCTMSAEYGDNYIPIKVYDKVGNVTSFKLKQGVVRVEPNSNNINIENNVNVW